MQAHFEDGKLNVQSTELYDFNMQKLECINTFDRLLKWPDATLVGDTLAVHDKTRQEDNFKVEFGEAGNRPASRTRRRTFG